MMLTNADRTDPKTVRTATGVLVKGIDPAQTFIDRQAHQMRRLPPW